MGAWCYCSATAWSWSWWWRWWWGLQQILRASSAQASLTAWSGEQFFLFAAYIRPSRLLAQNKLLLSIQVSKDLEEAPPCVLKSTCYCGQTTRTTDSKSTKVLKTSKMSPLRGLRPRVIVVKLQVQPTRNQNVILKMTLKFVSTKYTCHRSQYSGRLQPEHFRACLWRCAGESKRIPQTAQRKPLPCFAIWCVFREAKIQSAPHGGVRDEATLVIVGNDLPHFVNNSFAVILSFSRAAVFLWERDFCLSVGFLFVHMAKNVFSFRKSLRAVVVLHPLLGLTWIFGFLMIDASSTLVFTYLFTICNSLQGVLFFIFHCVMNNDVSIECQCVCISVFLPAWWIFGRQMCVISLLFPGSHRTRR